MTALATDTSRIYAYHQPMKIPLPVAANAVLRKGSLTATNASGLAIPAADTAGTTVQGVALEGIDNTGGAAGTLGTATNANYHDAARIVEVDAHGEWAFEVSAGTPKPGARAFVVDDNTVSAAATTNSISAGTFTRPATATAWYVDVARR